MEALSLASYNVAPTQSCPVVGLSKRGGWSLVPMRWGLVPSWAKDTKIGARMINARAETVAEKPAFRAAFKRRRCLVPATGFYEWRRDPSGKQPFHIGLANGPVFCFAGIWESWKPHLIWMDIRMPVMDGRQATRLIKSRPEGQDTIIIALTASVFDDEREAMLADGCAEFMRKPSFGKGGDAARLHRSYFLPPGSVRIRKSRHWHWRPNDPGRGL